MISKDFTYAVVGATNNIEKYGYKVLKDLKDGGYHVIPVNPNYPEILGLHSYSKISDISEKIDAVIFIVPPTITESLVDEVAAKGIKNVWMQPGSESESAIKKCQALGINCVANACIMVERHRVQ